MSRRPIVVFGIGNPSRGDDGLGPLLLERLDAPDVECIAVFQLQIEHALDLQGRKIAVFLDATVDPAAPFTFGPVVARAAAGTSHALSPGELVEVCRRVIGEPPPCFVLAIRGHRFELGDDPSPAGLADADAAWTFLAAWFRTGPDGTIRVAP